MSRSYHEKKATVDECHAITISFLKKHGYFKRLGYPIPGSIKWLRSGEVVGTVGFSVNTADLEVQFKYVLTERSTGNESHRDYTVQLHRTPCNLGGYRYYFICWDCQRHLTALYLFSNRDFLCRHCLNLTYSSRNVSKRFRGLDALFRHDEINEAIDKLRTKFYRGVPTRRYHALMQRDGRCSADLRTFVASHKANTTVTI